MFFNPPHFKVTKHQMLKSISGMRLSWAITLQISQEFSVWFILLVVGRVTIGIAYDFMPRTNRQFCNRLLSLHTWYACANGDKRDSGDRILEADGAAKAWRHVANDRRQNANPYDWYSEARPATDVVCKVRHNGTRES